MDRNDEFADRLTQSLPPERVSELRDEVLDEVLTDNTAALRIVEEAAARRYARHSLRRGLSIRELVECDFHQFGDRCVKVEALLPLDSEAQNGRQGEHDAPSHAGGNADAGDDDVPDLLRPVDIESGLARSSRLSASAAAYTPLTFEGDAHIVEGLASCAAPGAAFQAAFPAVWFANLRPEGGCRGCRV